jgi:hypothetical protein
MWRLEPCSNRGHNYSQSNDSPFTQFVLTNPTKFNDSMSATPKVKTNFFLSTLVAFCATFSHATIMASTSLPECSTRGSEPRLWTDCLGSTNLPNQMHYTGEWKNGKPEGFGVLLDMTNSGMYIGQFANGLFNGDGEYKWADDGTYKGQWKNGLREGKGTHTWADGGRYSGLWKGGFQDGHGTHTWADGSTYVGEYKRNQRNGVGTFKSADGKTVMSGTWYQDQLKEPSPSNQAKQPSEKSKKWQNEADSRRFF